MNIDRAPQPYNSLPPPDEWNWICFTSDGGSFFLPLHVHPESISEWREGVIEGYRKVPTPGRRA